MNAGGSVRGCMCVYMHTHTHTAQMGYSVVSPGVGMRHLEGPKNPNGLNLGICVFVYVYKVHMCMMMMMIAFITIKSSLVPLIEGLCAQIYFRFEISVVCIC